MVTSVCSYMCYPCEAGARSRRSFCHLLCCSTLNHSPVASLRPKDLRSSGYHMLQSKALHHGDNRLKPALVQVRERNKLSSLVQMATTA